jgi:hypothetical protein
MCRYVYVRIAIRALVLLLLIFSTFAVDSSGSTDSLVSAKIKIVPSVWYRSWATVVSHKEEKRDILCFIGNLSGEPKVSDIDVNSILLNGKVPIIKNSDTLLASYPGFTGAVLQVGFNRRDVLMNLGLLQVGGSRFCQICIVVVKGWIPKWQCQFSGFTTAIVKGFEPFVPLGITPKAGYGTPDAFELFQNYPNPFNPETEISYVLPTACFVELFIYNLLGQKVRMLVDESQSAGLKNVKWDGKDENGVNVASGIYFYKINAGEFTQSKKMVIIR